MSGASVEPRSLRPVIRRAEERTVYTGRRALVRNAVAVILSAAAVAVMMMSIMRWREGQHPRAAAAVVVLPPQPDTDPVQAGPAPTLVIVSPAAVPPPPVSPPRPSQRVERGAERLGGFHDAQAWESEAKPGCRLHGVARRFESRDFALMHRARPAPKRV